MIVTYLGQPDCTCERGRSVHPQYHRIDCVWRERFEAAREDEHEDRRQEARRKED